MLISDAIWCNYQCSFIQMYCVFFFTLVSLSVCVSLWFSFLFDTLFFVFHCYLFVIDEFPCVWCSQYGGNAQKTVKATSISNIDQTNNAYKSRKIADFSALTQNQIHKFSSFGFCYRIDVSINHWTVCFSMFSMDFYAIFRTNKSERKIFSLYICPLANI